MKYFDIGKLCSIISAIKDQSESLKVFNIPGRNDLENQNYYKSLSSCLNKKYKTFYCKYDGRSLLFQK